MTSSVSPLEDNQVKAVIKDHGLFVTNTYAMDALLKRFGSHSPEYVLTELCSYYGEKLEGWDTLNKFEMLLVLADLGYAYNELGEKYLTNQNY